VPFEAYSCHLMPTPSIDRANAENLSLGTRLDSWKEIATYLCRGERTVKRWETDRGLPIHRVPGGGRGSVYAYTVELTEWLKSSKDQQPEASLEELEEIEPAELSNLAVAGYDATPASLPPPETRATEFSRKQKWLLAFVGLALICIAGTALNLAAFRTAGRRLSASLFAKSQPRPNPKASPKVSDSERCLARDLYLRGRYQWSQRTPDSLNRALDSFTQSIVHDPSYAEAYVGLADTYDLLREYSTMPESDAFSRGIAAARKAVELDDSLSEAHRALAFAEFWGSWDFVGAESEFRRAIELNPKDPVARRWYANSFAMPGRFAECLEQIDKAQELDPSSPATLADKGMMLYNAGKTDEAIELLEEVERTNPTFRSPHYYMMLINLYLHRYRAYLAEGEKTAEIEGDPVLRDIIASAREGYARDGGLGLLQNLYTKQNEYYLAGKFVGTMLAKTCILMGKKQEALHLLEDAYAHHEPYFLVCLMDRDLLILKDEPRYRALIKKVNFPAVPANVLSRAPSEIDNPSSQARAESY
jgi:tetratricopeptide (TPR) repeat protein